MRYLAILGGVVVILCGAQVRADEETPDEFRFGMGVGFVLPADITMPNMAVASFRYKDIEIQPLVVLSSSKSDSMTNDGVTTTIDKDSSETVGAGAVFKYAFSRRNNMDLQLIGSLNYTRSTDIADPDGPNNRATTETRSFEIGYGLGLQWRFTSHVSLMATATNPVFADASTKTIQQQVGGTTVSETNTRSYGLVWDPSIAVAVMTWF